MNNLDKQYTTLLQTILDFGVEKKDRTGTGTKSIFGYTIRHNMKDGFPLLTTKKMAWKTMVTELLWFLRGDTNIKYLVDNNCHIWDGDAYQNYLKGGDVKWLKPTEVDTPIGKMSIPIPYSQEEFINKIKTDDEFAKQWGELGPIYGAQWRSWQDAEKPRVYIDQIANLINDLKTNPDSRRLMVNSWNVGELDQCVLPPCHYGFQVYTRELDISERLDLAYKTYSVFEPSDFVEVTHQEIDKLYPVPSRAISLMWNQRSVDTFLGLPFNIASYGLLLEIIAKEVNMVPDELIGNLGDVHLYNNHIEQAEEQIGRELTLEERRALVTQEQFDKIYTAGSPDTLSHSEIDQFGVPRRTREPFKLPKLLINYFRSDSNSIINDTTRWSYKDFQIEDYSSHPAIKAPLSN
jgi:thymidylate synthase